MQKRKPRRVWPPPEEYGFGRDYLPPLPTTRKSPPPAKAHDDSPPFDEDEESFEDDDFEVEVDDFEDDFDDEPEDHDWEEVSDHDDEE